MVGSLAYGVQMSRIGNEKRASQMMKLRVLSALFTFFSGVGGHYYEEYKYNRQKQEWLASMREQN